MRQIELGDINQLLLHTFYYSPSDRSKPAHGGISLEDHDNALPSFSLKLTAHEQDYLYSRLMGGLSYRSREPLRRLFKTISDVVPGSDMEGHRVVDLLQFWSKIADQFLEPGNTYHVKIEQFESWRRHFHSVDQDLPALAALALSSKKHDTPLNLSFVLRHFGEWPLFMTGADRQLLGELSKGIALQHLHLTGSYPAPFFWVGLMNGRFNPDKLFGNGKKKSNNDDLNRASRYQPLMAFGELREKIERAICLRKVLCYSVKSLFFESSELVEGSDNRDGDVFRVDYAASLLKKFAQKDSGDKKFLDKMDAYLRCPSLVGERLLIFLVFRLMIQDSNRRNPATNMLPRILWEYLQIKNIFLGTTQQREGIAGFDFFEYSLRMYSWDDPQFFDEADEYNSNAQERLSERRKLCAWEIGRFLQEFQNVVRLELMVSPKDDEKKYDVIISMVEDIKKAMDDRLSDDLKNRYTDVKTGLVVHLIKDEGEERFIREVLENDLHESQIKGHMKHPTAYTLYHRERRGVFHKQTSLLLEVIANKKNKKIHFVGIDAANRELFCPPEVLGQAYRLVTHEQRVGVRSAWINRKTLHVGEDFYHLATGMRRIYEAILYLEFQEGDRLGHCIAMGISPRQWTYFNPNASVHRIDLLDDALFEWILMRDFYPDPARVNQLRHRIAHYSMNIYGAPIEPEILEQAWRRRGEDFFQRYLDEKAKGEETQKRQAKNKDKDKEEDARFYGSMDVPLWVRWQGAVIHTASERHLDWKPGTLLPGPHSIAPTIGDLYTLGQTLGMTPPTGMTWPKDQSERVLMEYLYDYATIKRALEIESVDTLAELVHLERLQDALRNWVMQKGITVETNPSSNWLIGGFERHADVPAVRWARDHPEISFTINLDDPVPFASSPVNEYVFVYAALVRGSEGNPGLARSEALQRIAHIRNRGLETSFVPFDNAL